MTADSSRKADVTSSRVIVIPESEIEIRAIRASGPGGQNVNKVSSAVQLRFDIARSSLPEPVKQRWLSFRDHRIGATGLLVIKAQRFRTQKQNEADARQRLAQLLDEAATPPRPRKKTRPGKASVERRLRNKSHRSRVKKWRRDKGNAE